jgi:hypothetical protein
VKKWRELLNNDPAIVTCFVQMWSVLSIDLDTPQWFISCLIIYLTSTNVFVFHHTIQSHYSPTSTILSSISSAF